MPSPANVQPGGTLDTSRDLVVSGQIRSSAPAPNGGIGYATGAGSSVTQATNRTTAVTINALCGTITTNDASLAAEAAAAFVVNNTAVDIGDVVVVSQRSGAVALLTTVEVSAVAAGSFTLNVINGEAAAGTAETGAIIINFLVLKGVTS